MRVALFAPLRRASAIGWTYGTRVYNALARVAHVDFWAPAPVDAPPGVIRVVPFTAERYDEALLATYDLVLYNLGDNFEFHSAIYSVARRHPGIVILHDFVMHNFFRGYYMLADGGLPAYAAALERHYGLEGRKIAAQHLAGAPIQDLSQMAHFPLFEEAIAGARGVITHSKFLLDRVRTIFPGPSEEIFLAYDAPPEIRASKADVGVPDEKILIVSVGHLNRNRQISTVIEAIGQHPDLRARVRYHLVGPAHDRAYREHLEKLLVRYRLQDVVEFTGYADEATLRAHLSAADIFVNLRRPAIEGASASVLEQMLMRKPVVVADTGFYAELPDDTVLKVSAGVAIEEVALALQKLLGDPSLRERVGRRAYEYVRRRTTGEAWVETFFPFAQRVMRLEPAVDLVDRLSAHAILMGFSPDAPIIDRLVNEVHALFLEKS